MKIHAVVFDHNEKIYLFRAVKGNQFEVLLQSTMKVLCSCGCADVTEDNIDMILKQVMRMIE